MTSRTHAAHTTCPGCREEVYLDELVKGRCPLCGCTMDDVDTGDSEVEELLERGDFSWLVFSYFLFKQFTDLGASPLAVMQLISAYEDSCTRDQVPCTDTRFSLEIPMGRLDRLRLKQCGACGKHFIRGGRKVLSGDLSKPGYRVTYRCSRCT